MQDTEGFVVVMAATIMNMPLFLVIQTHFTPIFILKAKEQYYYHYHSHICAFASP